MNDSDVLDAYDLKSVGQNGMDHRHCLCNANAHKRQKSIENESAHTGKSSKSYLRDGGVNVNEATATSLSNELSKAATVIVHWLARFAAPSPV